MALNPDKGARQLVTQFASYTIVTSDTVEPMFVHLKGRTFTKLWIYPGIPNASTNLLTPNSNPVYVGEIGDGLKVCPDAIQPSDLPLKIELPEGEVKLLEELIIIGKAGEGVWVKFWDIPPRKQKL